MSDLQLLASGYGTVEGPAVDAKGDLYFGDITGGGVRKLTTGGDIELVIPKRKGVGGIILHRDGGIVVAGRDLSHFRNGENRVVLGAEDYIACGLTNVTGFNDISANEEGQILAGAFRMEGSGKVFEGPADFKRLSSSLILVTAEKQAKTLYEDLTGGTNGIALDWETKGFYHSHSHCNEVLAVDKVGPQDYRIARRISTAHITSGTPDGLVLDEEGCLWSAFYEGDCVARFRTDGTLVQRIDMPSHLVTSLCFGGPDGTDLYIVTQDNTADPGLGGCIFRTNVGVRGAPVAMAAI